MNFTGTIHAKLDVKGRVFLPSDFRRQLHEEGGGDLVLRRDVYQSCLVLMPLSVWRKEAEEVRNRLNAWNPRDAMVLRRFFGEVEEVSLDGTGRLLLPKRLQEICGISKEVRFIGVANHIEIWSPEVADRSIFDDSTYAEAVEALLGNHAANEE